ncbi:MAG: DUF4416 family protein [Phycisphaerales bacterium]|nr:DUF4416 family protein [Phycisphaerales bacterium]
MGVPSEPEKAVLIVGLLAGDAADLVAARGELESAYGSVSDASEVWPFAQTHYYEDELGTSASRQFLAFAEPFALDKLVDVKLATNALEIDLARRAGRDDEHRVVNIDPGYMTIGALVLATTKPAAHRIYLARGIYAEVTLRYESRAWRAWPWTYPDYAVGTYHPFFTGIRNGLKRRLRERSQ